MKNEQSEKGEKVQHARFQKNIRNIKERSQGGGTGVGGQRRPQSFVNLNS